MVSTDDLLYFIDHALDAMVGIVAGLGDELANRKPDLPESNTPFAILTHCLGVMEYWGGEVIAGRPIERDRDAEFVATGTVAELAERTRAARARLADDLVGLDPGAPPAGPVQARWAGTPLGRSQGGALVHIYEELAQHHGQMEGCRDVLLAPWARTVHQHEQG